MNQIKTNENAIRLEALEIGYYKNAPLLESINATARHGELIALLGTNGSGKSTLFKTIMNLIPPIAGKTMVSDKSATQYSREEFPKVISFISTEKHNIQHLSIWDFVALGRYPYTNWIGGFTIEDHNLVEKAITITGLEKIKNKSITDLSDGERQRASIARTLAQDTQTILMDEPTAYLDLPAKFELLHLLSLMCRQENKAIIFSTHDVSLALNEADKLWIIHSNTFIEGAPEDLLMNGTISKLFQNNGISLNPLTGNFSIQRDYKHSVRLYGSEPFYSLTKKGLNRIGYGVSENALTEVEITMDKDIYLWVLNVNQQKSVFYSSYELFLYLKNLNHEHHN